MRRCLALVALVLVFVVPTHANAAPPLLASGSVTCSPAVPNAPQFSMFAYGRSDGDVMRLVRLDVTNPCDTALIGTLTPLNGQNFLIKFSPGVALSLSRGDLIKLGVPVDVGGMGSVEDFGQPVDLVLTG
jgi:hypothetical protein